MTGQDLKRAMSERRMQLRNTGWLLYKDIRLNLKPINHNRVCTPESDCQWEDIDECIDLEDAEEKDSEMLKGLGEEVPEQTKVGGLVWNRKTAEKRDRQGEGEKERDAQYRC